MTLMKLHNIMSSFFSNFEPQKRELHVPHDLWKDIVEYMSSKFSLLGPWECDSLAYIYK